jgi:ribosome-binding factor A
MSTPRSLRVSQQIKRELADIILRDLKDERIAGLVSITDVDSSSDCRAAKVFISVYGEKSQQEGTMQALNDNLGFIRGEICRRLKLRFAPELSFKLDDSLERGAKVSALLAKISRGEI